MTTRTMQQEIAYLRDRVEELEAELAYRDEEKRVPVEVLVASALQIPHWIAPVVELFLSRNFVRHSTLDSIGDARNWGPTSNFHSLSICKLRKILCGTGVEIKTVHGQGYTINKASQERLNELVYGQPN
jgi:hypothetical protein